MAHRIFGIALKSFFLKSINIEFIFKIQVLFVRSKILNFKIVIF